MFDFYSNDAAKLIDKSDSESLKPGVGVISAEYEIEVPTARKLRLDDEPDRRPRRQG